MLLDEKSTQGERFGYFGSKLAFADLPADVLEKLKLHLLDTVAVSYAFAKEPLAAGLIDMARCGNPKGRATIIGSGCHTSAEEAAFVNGSFGHGKDFDDVHIASITHPTVVVAPAVLALAEAEHKGGAAVLTATAFGLEVCTRLGLAGGQAMADRGIPPMTACGTLAAAAAAARILDLDSRGIAAAIGLSGSFACGSHEWTIAGTNSKLTTPGWAARSAIISARMAQDGFDGSMTAIEGRKGLLMAMAGPGKYSLDELTTELGHRWEIRNLAIKRYASCQGTQPYIAATLSLLDKHDFHLDDIEEVEVIVGAGVGKSLSEPAEMKRNPPNPYAAKFSIPFCVALALSEGTVRLAHFEEDWPKAQGAARLAMKVRHTIDPAFDIGAAERGTVLIRLADGRLLQADHRTDHNALTISDVADKFAECADWLLGPDQRKRIIDAFLSLESVPDMGSIMKLLARNAP